MIVETTGSRWEIDETLGRYRRWPKEERPRDDPSHGGPDAGPLQDFVWHDFLWWEIREPLGELVIGLEPRGTAQCRIVRAPSARVVR